MFQNFHLENDQYVFFAQNCHITRYIDNSGNRPKLHTSLKAAVR